MSETDDPAGVPWRSYTVVIVLLSTAVAPLGVPLVSPTLPVVRDFFGVSDAETSLLVSGYFVIGIVLSPFIGILADRIGRKRILVSGLSVFGLLGGAMAFAPSFDVVLALRVLQGTGAAAIFITTVTIITDTFEGAQRNSVLGVNIAVLSAGAALYPVVGGALVSFGWNAPLLLYLVAVPIALVAALTLDDAPRPATRSVAYIREAAGAVVSPGIIALFGVTFLTEFLAFGVVFTALPFLLAPALSPVRIGAVLLSAEGASMLAAGSSGRLAQSLTNERIIALGFGCYGVGFLGAWAAPLSLLVAVPMFVAGAGIGLLLPAVDAAVSTRVAPDYRAGAFSLRNSTTFLGRASGPIAFTGLAVAGGVGYERLLLAAGLVGLAAAALVVLADARPSAARA